MPTIPANNNTGLYGIDGSSVAISNDVTVDNLAATGNITAGGFIAAQGNISSQGNITANYFIGNGSQLTNINAANIVGGYGNANVATFLANYGSNTVSTTGNITGGYIFGNGSQLTGLPETYSNANVVALMSAFGSNTIVTTGNITGGYFIGNGSQLTGLPEAYGNANVAAYLPTYTGNLAGGNIAVTSNGTIGGNLTVAGTIYGTFSGNITGNLVVPGSNTQIIYNNNGNAGANPGLTFNTDSNVLAVVGTANVSALNSAGNITSSANISGSYILGNGSQLTGLPESYGNANVAAYLPTYTGNIAAGNLTAATTTIIGQLQAQGNISTFGSEIVTLEANSDISIGTYGPGNGIQVTGPGIFGVANLTGTIATFTGNVAAGGVKTDNYYYANGTPISFAGTYSDSNVTTLLSSFGSNTISTTGNITAGNIIANGQALTNLPGANVTGTVANAAFATDSAHATVADSANAVAGANVSGTVANATYALNANASTVAGTVTTAAQPNITSVGTLSSLSVTGNVVPGGINTDNYRYANGTPVSFDGTYGNANVADYLLTANGAIGSGTVTGSTVPTEIRTTSLVTNTLTTASLATIDSVRLNTFVGTTGNSTIMSAAGGFSTNQTVTATGNVTGGNLVTGGQVVATGNAVVGGILTDNYYYANGTPISFGGTYGDSNVTTLMSAFGSNTISTTGNVTGGNIIATNLFLSGNISNPTSGVGGLFVNVADGMSINANAGTWAANISQSDGSGSGLQLRSANEVLSVKNAAGSTTLFSVDQTGATVTGNIGTTGILTDNYYYANGTPFTGGGSSYGDSNVNTLLASWGSNTLSTTGNATVGNIANTNGVWFNGSTGLDARITTNAAWDPNSANSTTPAPGRILIGSGYNGNTSYQYDVNGGARAGRLVVTDSGSMGDTQQRLMSTYTQLAATVTANVTNNNTRFSSAQNALVIGGGAAGNTINNNINGVVGQTSAVYTGTFGNLAVGNTQIGHATGVAGYVLPQTGSTVGNAVGLLGSLITQGSSNVTNAIGVFAGLPNNATGNAIAFYQPGTTNNYGLSIVGSSNTRALNNYYFVKTDDPSAKSDLGALNVYNEVVTVQGSSSTSGVMAVDRLNGGCQYIILNENVTDMSLSNFQSIFNVGSKTQFAFDTVTLLINPDGYSLSLPATLSSSEAANYANGTAVGPSTSGYYFVVLTYSVLGAFITISPVFE